jgi:MarR-like DNA-binding transcriptional regulator SgrR of sgrS sRNA
VGDPAFAAHPVVGQSPLVTTGAGREEVSRQAGELLLSEPQPESLASTHRVRPSGSPRHVTTALATSLTQLAELIEPAAAAAEEWLEAHDSEDRDAAVEARDQLLATLDESPELATITSQLARLLESVGRRHTS